MHSFCCMGYLKADPDALWEKRVNIFSAASAFWGTAHASWVYLRSESILYCRWWFCFCLRYSFQETKSCANTNCLICIISISNDLCCELSRCSLAPSQVSPWLANSSWGINYCFEWLWGHRTSSILGAQKERRRKYFKLSYWLSYEWMIYSMSSSISFIREVTLLSSFCVTLSLSSQVEITPVS